METVIDQCSLFAVYLEITSTDCCTGADITRSKATGSLYQHKGQSYLVTNWHVLSGRNAENGTPLDSMGALPEKVSVFFPKDGAIGTSVKESYSLKDDRGKYVWLQHRRGQEIDIALLPIDLPKETSIVPVNSINEARGPRDFPPYIHVGKEVFVLGFPSGVRNAGGLPIWKRASIASEPMIPVGDNEFKILIDTATREGMSGSPVIFVGPPNANLRADHTLQTVAFRPNKLFVGVYSGRIGGKDELAAQLGIVWKENAIREIVNDGVVYCDPY